MYHHADHLGSSHVETNASGTVLQYLIYEPYGKTRYNYQSGAYNDPYKFTGKELDTETGLHYYGARYYSAPVGRFISADPVFLALGARRSSLSLLRDPQSFNSYAYSRNSPAVLTDPNGKFWWYGFYDSSGYEGASGFAMKLGEIFGGHARAMDAVRDNGDTINEMSANNNVDPAVTTAIIVEEQSHLMPGEGIAERIAPSQFEGGVGLMQVQEATADNFGDYSPQDLARDTGANITAGTSYLETLGDDYSSYNGAGTHAELYEQRINAQLANPDYNTNIISDQINKVAGAVADYITNAF